MKKLLIICTGNSCRSQIAQGFMESLGAGKLEVFSAGIETHGVNPRAIKTTKKLLLILFLQFVIMQKKTAQYFLEKQYKSSTTILQTLQN
jgi:protein-tyrosine-phosphatase